MENKETGSTAQRADVIVIQSLLLLILTACNINSPPNPPTPTPEPPWPAETAPQSCDEMVGADFLIRARLGFCPCPKTLKDWGQAFREIFDTGVCVYGADGRLETY